MDDPNAQDMGQTVSQTIMPELVRGSSRDYSDAHYKFLTELIGSIWRKEGAS